MAEAITLSNWYLCTFQTTQPNYLHSISRIQRRSSSIFFLQFLPIPCVTSHQSLSAEVCLSEQ